MTADATLAADHREPYHVDPDRDTPEDIIEDASMLGRWLHIVGQYGNAIVFHSVEETVPGRWVVQYDTGDVGHLIARETVQRKLTQRWPDVRVHRSNPLGDADDE